MGSGVEDVHQLTNGIVVRVFLRRWKGIGGRPEPCPAVVHCNSSRPVYHVDQLRAGFGARSSRKCDTSKTLEFPTLWFGTRRSKPSTLNRCEIGNNLSG
jgi:hypothetical protein